MNNFLQMIGTFASIFSVPLAIIIYFKTSDARQNKIRLEIIRSLSYRIGEGKTLNEQEISAVLNSKVREYNLHKPLFTEMSILEDIIADAVSNPFLTSEQKTSIIQNISKVIQSYTIYCPPTVIESKRKRDLTTNIFSRSAFLISLLITIIATIFSDDEFLKLFSDYIIPSGILGGVIVSVIAALSVFTMEFLNKKWKKK